MGWYNVSAWISDFGRMGIDIEANSPEEALGRMIRRGYFVISEAEYESKVEELMNGFFMYSREEAEAILGEKYFWVDLNGIRSERLDNTAFRNAPGAWCMKSVKVVDITELKNVCDKYGLKYHYEGDGYSSLTTYKGQPLMKCRDCGRLLMPDFSNHTPRSCPFCGCDFLMIWICPDSEWPDELSENLYQTQGLYSEMDVKSKKGARKRGTFKPFLKRR